MELWMKYALIAAFFIAVRDLFTSNIARKYNTCEYIRFYNNNDIYIIY